ncbi:MAG TPA: GNAT family N-acetyltransferase [Streptosporangiaceae bacterium]|nr:GNAT family N-acetyltransferase [Streptosporangiaceae bacterium]
MEPDVVLAAYDAQVRRSVLPDGSGALVEVDGPVVRWATVNGHGWSGVTWSDLSDSDADSVIAAQAAYFRDRGEEFEWKLYDYDRPPDLPARLLRAGFAAEPAEALMVADSSAVATEVALSPGVRLVPVTDAAGVGMLIDVHERVFGTDHSRLRRSLTAQLRDAPELTAMVVAVAGDEPVCSARVEFIPGREFAGMWGGGTLPAWRGQGIYRALVAYRARLAVQRGYRYLQVDASPESEPILGRLGFAVLARTTPYVWTPANG